jgi:hypothetical protein
VASHPGDGHRAVRKLAVTLGDGIDAAEEGAPARRRPRKRVTGSVYQHAPRRAPGLCQQATGATFDSYR